MKKTFTQNVRKTSKRFFGVLPFGAWPGPGQDQARAKPGPGQGQLRIGQGQAGAKPGPSRGQAMARPGPGQDGVDYQNAWRVLEPLNVHIQQQIV